MKKLSALICGMVLVGLQLPAGLAQQVPSTAPASGPAIQQGLLLDAASVIGMSVRDAEGKNMGRIEQLMVEPKEGRIAYAVVSVGGFLGIGDKLVALPWDAMKLAQDQKTLVLNVERQFLEQAPAFEKGKGPQTSGRQQAPVPQTSQASPPQAPSAGATPASPSTVPSAAAMTIDCPPASVGGQAGATAGRGVPVKRVEGQIKGIDSTARRLEIENVKLEVGSSTTILVDCKKATMMELKEGTTAKVAYEEKDGRNLATVIEAEKK